MTNAELKSLIEAVVPDAEICKKIVVLEGDEFADGAIGITDDHRVVYSYERLVESLAKDCETNDSDTNHAVAIEWLDYNTFRALPYLESQGLIAPLIIHEF